MKKYVRPMIVTNTELAEGVYAGSGDCYTFSAYIHQKPELGNEVYSIQIDGVHHATDGHHSSTRSVMVTFNQPVTYVSSNAAAVEGSGTNQIQLTFVDGVNGSYHNNGGDNIGLGQLKVQAADGLAITGCYSTYCNQVCDQHH